MYHRAKITWAVTPAKAGVQDVFKNSANRRVGS
jgi:hypothetical protein